VVPFALCALYALGLALGERTRHAAAEEKPTPPVAQPKDAAPPPDLAEQVAELEKKIAELRKQRKSMAGGAVLAAERFTLLREAPGCGVREYQDELDTLHAFHRRVEVFTTELRSLEDRFVAFQRVSPAGYLELTVRGAPKNLFVLKMRDATGAELGLTTVSGWSEPVLTRVLLRMQAAPGMPKELRLVAQPTILDRGVVPALKACGAAGYKTVTFTGFVPSREDSPKPNESGPPRFKWYDEEAMNPAELANEIENVPKR